MVKLLPGKDQRQVVKLDWGITRFNSSNQPAEIIHRMFDSFAPRPIEHSKIFYWESIEVRCEPFEGKIVYREMNTSSLFGKLIVALCPIEIVHPSSRKSSILRWAHFSRFGKLVVALRPTKIVNSSSTIHETAQATQQREERTQEHKTPS